MVVFGNDGYLAFLTLYRRPKSISSMSNRSDHLLLGLFSNCSTNRRCYNSGTDSSPPELSGENAYDLLGVSESSSFAEIKASFRKLAKETHPDLAQSPDDFSTTSRRFVQILAAYEILSDTEKRAHYDMYLSSQKTSVQQCSRQKVPMYKYGSYRATVKQMEVVEWLKWYRYAIGDILSEKRIVDGSSYFDVLERDFYSAIHAAYYGPEIESMDLLPDCFEADERSVYGIPEVLHLVSGRDIFGMVCIANKVPEWSQTYKDQLPTSPHGDLGVCLIDMNRSRQITSQEASVINGVRQIKKSDYDTSDAYKDLELHLSGRIIANATRVPPKIHFNGISGEDSQDHIHIYLKVHKDPIFAGQGAATDSRVQLGTIIGLGTSPEEGSCFVYNKTGMKTHVIMKHRTLMVKHMHWYQLGDETSVCECRCSRAWLPPSRYWLFEPRSGMHDVGGWYVETFGRDGKGRLSPSRRYWDGFDTNELSERRVHPAMYLLALAYRTLDIEDAKRRKQAIGGIAGVNMSKIFSWCKKLL